MVNILAISGSLRLASTNSRLLAAAGQLWAVHGRFHVTGAVASLPLFSPDLDPEQDANVVAWASEVRAADGLVISTPEYARGYPGALKNALDWLVGGDAFVAKPYCFLHASSRARVSHETLATVLDTMSGIHVRAADRTVPLLGTDRSVADIVADPQAAAAITELLATLVADIGSRRS